MPSIFLFFCSLTSDRLVVSSFTENPDLGGAERGRIDAMVEIAAQGAADI